MRPWRYIEEDNVSADYGLAADEFLMRYYPVSDPHPEPTLRLYTYRSHCALVGRFQNLEAELNLDNCQEADVQIGRRPTGGGAILMGGDQLGICITTSAALEPSLAKPADVYHRFAAPVIHALQQMGVRAVFRPKNDLEVGGKKIAGLGVYYDTQGAILFHTSLLVDLDIPLMLRVLRIPTEKYSDKVLVRSVRQRITTVSGELQRRITVAEVREVLKKSMEEVLEVSLKEQPFTAEEKAQINVLAEEKYRSEEWLYQRSPQADMTGMSVKKTPAGLLRTYIGLKGEIIKSVLITGDFFETASVFSRIEAGLKWSPLDRQHIRQVVENAFHQGDIHLVSPISTDDVVDAIWSAAQSARVEHRFTYRGSCYYPSIPASQPK